jgi:hypothetical protein
MDNKISIRDTDEADRGIADTRVRNEEDKDSGGESREGTCTYVDIMGRHTLYCILGL